MNKIPLNYLVFDDENEELNQNKAKVKVNGVDLNLIFINPVNFLDLDTNEFKIEEFVSFLDEELKGKPINLIASDWNMVPKTVNHGAINALEIIKILVSKHEKFKKIQYLIYSGKPKEVSEVIITEIKSELKSTEEPIYSKELLSKLLEMKIKFCSRNQRFDEINTLINSSKTISLIVLNSLGQFNRSVISNTGNKDFDGKEIGNLLDLISVNNDLGLKFVREIIELSIAHYSEINE
ncbi:hypothetical protein FHR24_002078 [Wenyingzhuangia heitensis]|uniref:Uncharacterized protein n=1 Tax=Wenyingzhuangia heitensis TaxID=1487859 RepID=A0ABX0UCR3_9FLAO|nr:hypothetical protein [Wenyingzhuangia heitensis]NIJ45610.1 hypothetical protein [Wenyingzhuangia heitensis]